MPTTEWSAQLLRYSDPCEVVRRAKLLGYDSSAIQESRTKTRKYAIITPDGKRVNFGMMGYQDYTKHRDKERRALFRKRNAKWASMPPYSPATLSYYLLW